MSYQIFLASASPRRLTLLQQLGLYVETISCDIDERVLPNEKPSDYVKRMAFEKGVVASKRITHDSPLIISADTSVILGQHILGKPINFDDYAQMMQRLSGNTHQVYTSVCVRHLDIIHEMTSISDVTFSVLSALDIKNYWQTGEPIDKAGGYGIQGKGALWITNISGSYSGIMGLPLFETGAILQKMGIKLCEPTQGNHTF